MLFFEQINPKKLTGRPEWRHLVEPTAIFALIMLYIWHLRAGHQSFWLFILGIIVASHAARGEMPGGLGFRLTNFRQCLAVFSPVLLFLAVLLLSLGTLAQTTRDINFERGVLGLFSYCIWGLFQQYLLNSYFVNRLQAFTTSPDQAAFVAALFFSGAHLPNWFLMLVTYVGGFYCAKVYMKYKNLYFLGLAHGAIGFLLYLVVPDSISHHLLVGPGWFRS